MVLDQLHAGRNVGKEDFAGKLGDYIARRAHHARGKLSLGPRQRYTAPMADFPAPLCRAQHAFERKRVGTLAIDHQFYGLPAAMPNCHANGRRARILVGRRGEPVNIAIAHG